MRGLSPRQPAADADPGDLSGVVVRLIDGTPLDGRARAGLLRRLSLALATSAKRAGALAVGSGRWLTDTVVDFAPHIPVRDAAALREHYHGLFGDDLARALIEAAAHGTGVVGMAGGVVSSIEFATPPLLLTSPVQVAAETLAVVAIELKLVAELHEAYGQAVVGTPAVRAAAYLGAWTRRRGLDPLGGGGLTGILSGAARQTLRRRLMRRAGENAVTVMPFMTGAVAGASLNSRETKKLGRKIANDLGGHLR